MSHFAHVIPIHMLEQKKVVNVVPKGVELIQAPELWKETKGEGITVAVLDTGCDVNHPDLKDRVMGEEILQMMMTAVLKSYKIIMAMVLMYPEQLPLVRTIKELLE